MSNYRGWRIAEVVSECEAQGVPLPVVCQPYYNLLNRMPEVEILPACDHYGIGVAPYSPIARGVLTGKYRPGVVPEDSRVGRKDPRMMETEFREESFAIAQILQAHAEKTGRTATQFALAWLWANEIVTSVIAGPRTLDQWRDYVGAIGTKWNDGGRGARRFAGHARTSVDARLQRSAVSVPRTASVSRVARATVAAAAPSAARSGMAAPRLSIVTCCKGRLEFLKRALPTFVAQSDSEVIVVDYDCPDGTKDWVAAHFPDVRVARSPLRRSST